MFLKTSCFLFVILALGKTSKISTKGKKIDEGRIVGGFQTDIENFPYIASLQFLGSHICGCSIVTSTYAVTAAHCTTTFKVLKVRYGSSTHASGGLISNVMCTREHPLHNPITNDYDIAVVKIMGNFFDSPVVRPIPLCAFDSVPGTVAFIIGWGVLTEGGSVPTNLQVAQVPVITNEECQAEYGQNAITIRMLCAGYRQGGVDSCQGDSGGPLAVNGQLCGVVSWGDGCAKPDRAGVYGNMTNQEMKDFVTKTVTGIVPCSGV